MPTAIVLNEVTNGEVWAKAWRKGAGSRHEMFAAVGVKARTFRDAKNPNLTGLILEVPDLARIQALLESPEGQKAMREYGLKGETMRVLVEFTP